MIQSWNDIKGDGWKNLLLGNGFSTNIWDKYSYSSLYEYSKANSVKPVLTKEIISIFDQLNTINFEEVLKALAYALLVKQSIGEDLEKCLSLYKTVQDNLFNTVYEVHIEYSDVKKEEIADEIKKFEKIYTTCYDLILYWASYNSLHPRRITDFFWNDSMFDRGNTNVYGKKIEFHYLHGALHLQQDLKGYTSKIKHTSSSLQLNQEFNYNGSDTKVPLYISEGNSDYKLKKILSNHYLTFCYQNFSKMTGTLVIVGHSLNKDYDNHLVKAIIENRALTKVAVSIYSAQSTAEKAQEVKDLGSKLNRSGLELVFFESNSYPLINESVKPQV